MSVSKKEKVDIYQAVTDKILNKLEEGVIPWQRPWDKTVGIPRNIVTNKPYQGINSMILGSQAYDSPYWLSFKQCQEKGGKVKKGEKGSIIVFWSYLDKTTGKTVDRNAEHEGDIKGGRDVVPILRYYTIFNTNQCEGLDVNKIIEGQEQPQAAEIMPAQQIVAGYKDGPEIKHGFVRACFKPREDIIEMPNPERFKNNEGYYGVLFHEMVHSTGLESRCNRKFGNQFGDEKYSKEELVAEMGAAFLCAKTGIENTTIDTSAAYIKSWMKALQDDKKLLITAAGQAQKAVNYITNDLEQKVSVAVKEPESTLKKAVGMER